MPFPAVIAAVAAVALMLTPITTSSIGATALIVVSRPGRQGVVGSSIIGISTSRCRHPPNCYALTTTTTTTTTTPQKSSLVSAKTVTYSYASSSSSSLRLTPLDNNNNDNDNRSDYSKQKQKSELDSLITKRQQIRQSKLANIKPNDDNPKIEEMSDEEIKEMLKMKGTAGSAAAGAASSSSSSSSSSSTTKTTAMSSSSVAAENNYDDGGNFNSSSSSDGISSSLTTSSSTPSLDIDALFSRDYVPDFKTKRSSASFGSRAADASPPPPSFFGGSGDDSDDDSSSSSDRKEQDIHTPLFVDWTADYEDENEFHIPNRIGFTTIDWADAKRGFVNGKLKKKDRKLGKYNQSDLKVRVGESSGCVFVSCSNCC